MGSSEAASARCPAAARLRYFHLAFAPFGMALFATTWKLWTPQQVFPQVPFAAVFGTLPNFVPTLLLFLSIGSLTSVGVLAVGSPGKSNRLASVFLLLFAASTTLLLLLNQHRLQPWAYQWIIFAVVLAVLPANRALALLRWVVVSVYCWSAIAKLDYSFVDTLGQQFLSAGGGAIGFSVDHWEPSSRQAVALMFPLVELLIAIGFCFPLQRTTWLRRGVLSLVVGMHGTLILLLSPLGLSHEPAVLVWNAWFIAQALLLFGFPPAHAAEPTESALTMRQEFSGVVVEFLVAAVILLPVLTLLNRFDHWPAWGLYAPRNSRATLYIHESAVDRLPTSMRNYLSPTARGDGWRQLRLDSWSLAELSVPIYPQDRFQVAVAAAVVERYQLQNDFQLIVQPPPDRLTGKRAAQTIRSAAALDAQQRSYFFNARSAWATLDETAR